MSEASPNRRTSRVSTDGKKPISSSEKHGFWLFGIMAAVFLGVSLPGLKAIPDEAGNGNWMILLVLLFPLAGLWLAYMAWKTWRNWRYYGPAPLYLNPEPGQIGGDIGGLITLNRRLDKEHWSVTLQCVRIRISGTGKNRSRHERVLWQADQVPEVRHSADGSEVLFCLETPSELPATDDKGSNQIEWRLLLTGPTEPIPLERSYTLPAQPGSARSTVELTQAHVRHHAQRSHLEAITDAAEQIDVQPTSNGLVIHSRAGRNLGMKFMILVFGLVFSAVGIGLGGIAAREGLMLYLMAAAFCLFGFPMLVGGVFMMGRSLSARIEGTQVTVVRSWCGRTLWQRRGNLHQADQLLLENNATTTQGRKTTEFFSLAMKDGRKTIRLAEGLVGRSVAEAFRDNLTVLLALPGTAGTNATDGRTSPDM